MAEQLIFKKHKKGTTLLAQKFCFKKASGEAPLGPVNLTGCIITLQMKTDLKGEVEYEMSTTDGKIVITDALEGKFETVQHILTIPAFDYICAIQINFPSGVVLEPMSWIWPINQDLV